MFLLSYDLLILKETKHDLYIMKLRQFPSIPSDWISI